jgi:hypothetical protein
MLDLINEVRVMLQFSSHCARQATRGWQDNIITEDAWNTRCKAIREDHRLSKARAELEKLID